MLLQKIVLNNFRQYYGKQVIEFSQSRTKNVTVIHGENGSGKTALLHAFIWCLYGDLDLPNPDSICNEHAANQLSVGEQLTASVTIEFEAFSKKYFLTRSVKVEKKGEDSVHKYEDEINLEYIDIDGRSNSIKNQSQEINYVLPKELRSYFFFDGERIDNLAKDSGSEDIKKAIKSMMGLEILERSIRHTDQARKNFRTELKGLGDPETQRVYEELEKLEKEIYLEVANQQLKLHNLTSLS